MIGIIYAMVAMGVVDATGKFWKAALWPYHAGLVIGQAVNAGKITLKS